MVPAHPLHDLYRTWDGVQYPVIAVSPHFEVCIVHILKYQSWCSWLNGEREREREREHHDREEGHMCTCNKGREKEQR